jgi:hypothetical protein
MMCSLLGKLICVDQLDSIMASGSKAFMAYTAEGLGDSDLLDWDEATAAFQKRNGVVLQLACDDGRSGDPRRPQRQGARVPRLSHQQVWLLR